MCMWTLIIGAIMLPVLLAYRIPRAKAESINKYPGGGSSSDREMYVTGNIVLCIIISLLWPIALPGILLYKIANKVFNGKW